MGVENTEEVGNDVCGFVRVCVIKSELTLKSELRKSCFILYEIKSPDFYVVHFFVSPLRIYLFNKIY